MQEVGARRQAFVNLLNKIVKQHLKPAEAHPIKGIALVWAYEDGAVGYAFNVESLSIAERVGIGTILQRVMVEQGEDIE